MVRRYRIGTRGSPLDPHDFLPVAGQGVIGLEAALGRRVGEDLKPHAAHLLT